MTCAMSCGTTMPVTDVPPGCGSLTSRMRDTGWPLAVRSACGALSSLLPPSLSGTGGGRHVSWTRRRHACRRRPCRTMSWRLRCARTHTALRGPSQRFFRDTHSHSLSVRLQYPFLDEGGAERTVVCAGAGNGTCMLAIGNALQRNRGFHRQHHLHAAFCTIAEHANTPSLKVP